MHKKMVLFFILFFSTPYSLGMRCMQCTRAPEQLRIKIACDACNQGFCMKCYEYAMLTQDFCSRPHDNAISIKFTCDGCREDLFYRLVDDPNYLSIMQKRAAQKVSNQLAKKKDKKKPPMKRKLHASPAESVLGSPSKYCITEDCINNVILEVMGTGSMSSAESLCSLETLSQSDFTELSSH